VGVAKCGCGFGFRLHFAAHNSNMLILRYSHRPLLMTAVARRVAALLESSGQKVVFAESCTGGLVSGALTKIPGISRFLCGGMIVYRNETKTAWLDIPAELLEQPGPVSAVVAELMARRVIEVTPEADWGVSVTGHLGPNAPRQLDGVVFLAVARRNGRAKVKRLRCKKSDSRNLRQRWAVEQALAFLAEELSRKIQKP